MKMSSTYVRMMATDQNLSKNSSKLEGSSKNYLDNLMFMSLRLLKDIEKSERMIAAIHVIEIAC